MTKLCRDVSNYSVPLTPALLAQWKAEGVGLVICQAFPDFYKQYPNQRDQMRECAAAGIPFDCYIYDYVGNAIWLDRCLEGLTTAATEGAPLPRMLWLDEEDVESPEFSAQQRITAINWSLIRADQWSADRGLQRAGVYSAAWWWKPRTGDATQFSDRKLWAAEYHGVPDATRFTSFGGWPAVRVLQYAGSQPDGTDLNVLSVEEEAELGGPEPVPDPDCQRYKAALERVVNRIQIEDERKTAAGKPAALRRTVFREVASEAFEASKG